MEKEGRERNMARRPLGPLLVVPQFEDMINAPETRISVPREPVVNQILDRKTHV